MAAEDSKFNSNILISPLDWGLGHATRCITIIKALQQKGCRVIVATSGFHQVLLQQEFPELLFLPLQGYGIKYTKKNMMLGLLFQLPKFFNRIKNENSWVQKVVTEYSIDAIVSDNRYGLYAKNVHSIFITHQLQPKLPKVFAWMENFVRNRLYNSINKFDQCWVPDVENEQYALAGSLSHPLRLPKIPVRYIGWLSRFKYLGIQQKKYRVIICLSGPEPQRTLLEAIVLPQLKDIVGDVLLIRGLPGAATLPQMPANALVANHLGTKDLEEAFLKSEYVVSRSGYSTLMDMKVLGCKCIYVPTPGQTEQEYLGKILAKQKIALVKTQADFNLVSALQEADAFEFAENEKYKNNAMEPVISDWLQKIANKKMR